jgi:predicted  nucleic acid-binding Zn-ribbon protein
LANMDLKTQVIGLVRLQALDSEIYVLGRERSASPQAIKALEAAFELKKQDLAALEQKALDLQKQRKVQELELAANAEGIKKLSGQLFSLKTNKEFQVMQQQIADAQADAAVIEEKILIFFEESDKIKAQIDSENLKLKDEEKIFLLQKKAVEVRSEEIAGRLSQLEAQRKQIIPDIDHKIVPPQVINLIKMYEHIITCEVCNRILYISE